MTRYSLVPVCLLVVSSLWLPSCSCNPIDLIPRPRLQPSPSAMLPKLSKADKLQCAGTEWIVRGCGDVEGWTHERLLGTGPVDAPLGSAAYDYHQLFGDYCVYTRTDDDVPDDDANANLAESADEFFPNCTLTVASTNKSDEGDIEAETLKLIHQAFIQNLGLPTAPPDKKRASESGSNVTVAIIDNAPRRVNTTATHGAVMRGIVDEIIALDNRVSTVPIQAITPTVRDTRGVIQAIYQATEKLTPRDRLIINLSLGWEPLDDPHLTDLAKHALRFARCRGALVFAAAGNKHLGACGDQTTMLQPAAWYQEDTACELLATSYWPYARPLLRTLAAAERTSISSQPLVRAVSAVDEHGVSLPTNRAQAELEALGRLAVVEDTAGRLLPPMTGTSVSTAVVSAVAAVVWRRDSTLTADAVASRLGKSGTGLVKACTAWGQDCPQSVSSPNDAWRGLCSATTTSDRRVNGDDCTSEPPTCSRERFVSPQPSHAPCKGCVIKPLMAGSSSTSPRDELSLSLSDDYSSYQWKDIQVDLTIRTTDGGEEDYSYVVKFEDNEPVTILGNYPDKTSYAYVTMYFFPDGSTTSGTSTEVAGNEIAIDPPPK